jgi:4-amino-4-deoxy-L-arabinose transferase-like glycosyltransferase
MNGFHNVFLSPLHFATCWVLFHFAPATCFSVRVLMGILGLVALALVGLLVARYRDKSTAAVAVLLIGLSFVMITVNRRAYLEGAVILLSPLAVLLSGGRNWRHWIALAICVAVLLAYKSNAVYLLPALLIPALGETRRATLWRAAALAWGVAMAALLVYLVARAAPQLSAAAMHFELSKPPGPAPWFHVGRFGLSRSAMAKAVRALVAGQTDLVVVTGVAIGGFLALRAWRDRFALRMAVWLMCGYVFFLAQPNHPQYFAPLIIPAGILAAWVTVGPGRRALPALVVAGVAISSLVRLGIGYRQSLRSNPPAAALNWLSQQGSGASPFLAAPEIVIASSTRGYAFNRIFHPLPPLVAPPLVSFLRAHAIRYVIFDEWETAEFFQGDAAFHAALAGLRKVGTGDGWVAFDTGIGQ